MTTPEPATFQAQQRSRPLWPWVLGGCGLLVLLVVGAMLVFFYYVGSTGPETDVYAGNEVPDRFLEAMREVGALEPGERIDYFYSDSLVDIRDGFYFVSDRRVVVYKSGSGERALNSVEFDQIADVRLDRDESFFIDSQLTLELEDGSVVACPLSSEHEGDVRFYETVRERVGGAGASG